MAADLEFRIGAELSELKAALAAVKKDIASVGQAATAAGKSNPFKPIVDGAKEAEAASKRARDARGRFVSGGGGAGGGGGAAAGRGGLGGLLGAGATAGIVGSLGRITLALAAVGAAIKLIGEADELNTLNARLKLVTSSTEDFTLAQKQLFDVAQRTRSGLTETIKLYAQIASATKDAGVGQDVLLDVVETINKAVQLSGASTQAAEAALVQLGQGLASGTLRGEELNSVLEQTPALADAIAKGMGITRGELRKFGQEGKIGAEQVITALQKQKSEVDRQFAELPVTVGQAVTQVKNASLRLLGAFDTSAGATKGLAGTIADLAEFLQSDEVLGAVVEFATVWSTAFSDIAKDIKETLRIVEETTKDLAKALGLEGKEGLVTFLIRAFRELPINLRSVVRILTVTFAGMVDSFVADAKLAAEAVASIFNDDTLDAAIARRNARVNASLQAVKESIDDILAERDQKLRDAKDIGKGAVAQTKAATPAKDRSGQGKFTTQLTDEQKRKAEALRKAQLEALEQLEKDSISRIAQSLADSYEDSLIGAQAYYDARARIETNAANQAIAIEKARIKGSTDPAEIAKAKAAIEILERSKNDIQTKAARDLVQAQKAIDAELEQARAQQLENSGRTAEAAKIRIEAQFRDLLKKLDAAGNTAGAALIRGLINAGGAKAEFDQLRTEFDRGLADLQARQAAIADQQKTGALGTSTASQQQADARAKAIADLTVLNEKLQTLAATTNDPAIVEGARRSSEALRQLAIDSATGIEAAIQELRASLAQLDADFAKMATGAGVNALTQFFTDIAEGTKSGSEALRDFVLNFVRSMAQIASQALATFAVLTLLDAIFPGLGKLVAAGGGSVGARVKHAGGDASQGPIRYVNPLVFAGAPRLHNGTGQLGLKAGEIPAILQQGEKVTPRGGEPGAAGTPAGGTRIINVIDPNLVQDYLTSSGGERTILNVIERNAGAVRQKLG